MKAHLFGSSLAIWSPYTTGHHPSYAFRVCQTFAQNFSLTTLFAPYPYSSLLIANELDLYGVAYSHDSFSITRTVDYGKYPANSFLGQLLQFISIIFCLIRLKPSSLCILYSDSQLVFVPLVTIFSFLIGCKPFFIWFRLRPHLSNNSTFSIAVSLYQILTIKLSSYLGAQNYTTDFFSFSFFQSRHPNCLTFLPEQCITPRKNLAYLEKRACEREPLKMLIFGVIDARKNINLLVDSLLSTGLDIHLVCAGRVSPSAKLVLSQLPSAMVTYYDYFCSNTFLSELLYESQAIWCVQSGHDFASATICSAIAFGKIAIITHGYYINSVSSGYNKSVTPRDFFSFGQSEIESFSNLSPSFDWTYEKPLFCQSWDLKWF